MDRRQDSPRAPDSRVLPERGQSVSPADDPSAIPARPAQRQDIAPLPASGLQNRFAVWAVCGFLLLAVGLVFGQTVRHEFVNFDDNLYVYDNPHIFGGLTARGIAWVFTHEQVANWHPLTGMSYLLDCQLFGVNPAAHHLINALLQAATAVVLFLVLRQMTGRLAQRRGGGPLRRASAPRGIGGVDLRAEGRFERAVFRADVGGLCPVRPRPCFLETLPAAVGDFRPGLDGQADAGDVAAGVALIGLLAAGTVGRELA